MPDTDLEDYSDKDVKKRSAPQLTGTWWSSAWPGDKKPACNAEMLNALKMYKHHKRKAVPSHLVSALEDLQTVSAKVKAEAKTKLKKTPKRREAIINDMKKIDVMIVAQLKDARSPDNKAMVVFKKDYGAALTSKLKADAGCWDFTFPKMMFEHKLLRAIMLEIDDAGGLENLNTEFNRTFDASVALCAKEVSNLLAERFGRSEKKTKALVQKLVDKHLAELSAVHFKVPTNVIKRIGLDASMEADYQKDLKKRRLAIVKSTGFTIAAGAAIALPGTQGFAIYGFVRSSAGLAQQIVEHKMTMAQKAKVLREQLDYMHKVFLKEGKKQGKSRAASETGGTTLNALLGVDIYPTLEKALSNHKELVQHTRHASFKARKLSKEMRTIQEALNELAKMEESIPDGHSKKKKTKKALVKAEKGFAKMFDKIAGLNGEVIKVENKLPGLKKTLAELGKNSRGQIAANNIAKVVVNLTAIAGGGLVDATAATTACDTVLKSAEGVSALTIASVGYADELRTAVSDVVDFAKT